MKTYVYDIIDSELTAGFSATDLPRGCFKYTLTCGASSAAPDVGDGNLSPFGLFGGKTLQLNQIVPNVSCGWSTQSGIVFLTGQSDLQVQCLPFGPMGVRNYMIVLTLEDL